MLRSENRPASYSCTIITQQPLKTLTLVCPIIVSSRNAGARNALVTFATKTPKASCVSSWARLGQGIHHIKSPFVADEDRNSAFRTVARPRNLKWHRLPSRIICASQELPRKYALPSSRILPDHNGDVVSECPANAPADKLLTTFDRGV